jgi:hypothetical protein
LYPTKLNLRDNRTNKQLIPNCLKGVAITVTEAKQKVIPENAGTKFVSTLKLITPVTI